MLKVGVFIVTTQALNITADYTIRIMTLSKGVSYIAIIVIT